MLYKNIILWIILLYIHDLLMQPGVNPVGEVSSLPHFFSDPMESDSFVVFLGLFFIHAYVQRQTFC